MSASALSSEHTARESLALALSLGVHLAAALLIGWVGTRPAEPPRFEVTFLPGPPEPASSPPGEAEAGPGSAAAAKAPVEPEPVAEVPPAKPEPPPGPKRAEPKPKIPPPKPAVEERGLLGALRKTAPEDTSRTRAFPELDSPVRLRERPAEGSADGGDAEPARTEVDVAVEERLRARSSGGGVGGRLEAGDAPLPGAGSGAAARGPGGSGGTGHGGFSVTGAGAGGRGRSYQSIWDHTQQYITGLRWAYNRELRHDPELRGVVLVRFEILSSGKVGSVRIVSSELDNQRFEREVVSQIRDWTYPTEDTGDVVVTWPFSFLPPSS